MTFFSTSILLEVIFIPFVIAKLCKRVLFRNLHTKLEDYYNIIILTLLSLMMMITMAYQSEYILANINKLLPTLGALFIVVTLFFPRGIAGILGQFKKNNI